MEYLNTLSEPFEHCCFLGGKKGKKCQSKILLCWCFIFFKAISHGRHHHFEPCRAGSWHQQRTGHRETGRHLLLRYALQRWQFLTKPFHHILANCGKKKDLFPPSVLSGKLHLWARLDRKANKQAEKRFKKYQYAHRSSKGNLVSVTSQSFRNNELWGCSQVLVDFVSQFNPSWSDLDRRSRAQGSNLPVLTGCYPAFLFPSLATATHLI